MMKTKKELFSNHNKLEISIDELIRNGLEVVADNFSINNHSQRILKELLLESFLLRSCAYWEYFLEKEIILLIKLNPESFKNYYQLSSNLSLNINLIRAIIIGDTYRDWHNIQGLKGHLQKIIDPKANPFIDLTNEQHESLNFIYTLRNYLSHYSEYSKKKLLSVYKTKHEYRRFIEPGGFLAKGKGKHFESLLHNFILISVTIRKNIGI